MSSSFAGVSTFATPSTGCKKLDYTLFPFEAGWRLRNLERQFDLFIARMAPAAAATLRCKKPVIFHTADWQYLVAEAHERIPFWPRRLDFLLELFERRLMTVSDAVTVTGPLLLPLLMQIPTVNAYVIPNGVDPSLFFPFENSDGRSGRRIPVVGFIGSSKPEQGLVILMQALHMINRKRLRARGLVVGRVSDETRRQARLLGLEGILRFAGQVEYSQLPWWINQMDICVSPLQRIAGSELYTEFAQPFKVLESMACAKPVLVTPLREQRRIVCEAECGFVARDFTGIALMECLVDALDAPDLLQECGAKGRSYILANHTWEKSCDALATLCGSLL